MCVPLTNVTLVIPSQEEIDYLEFMATMYNSPSQALRSLASFYNTDLRMTKFEVSFAQRPACVIYGRQNEARRGRGLSLKGSHSGQTPIGACPW